MQRILAVAAAFSLVVFVGCQSDDDGGTTVVVPPDDTMGAGGGGGQVTGRALIGLTFTGFEDTTAQVGAEVRLTVEATYDDGVTEDVTDQVVWTSSDVEVLTVSAGVVTMIAPGTATVRGEFEGSSGAADFTVEAAGATLDSITVSPQTPRLELEGEEQFSATAHYSDGSTADVTDEVEWTVDDVRVLDLDADAPGHAAVLAGGPVRITASLGEISGSVGTTVRCGEYPRYADVIRFRGIMPPVSWESAFNRAGDEMEFGLDDMRCFADYEDTQTLVVVFGAGWCPACTVYTRLVDRIKERLDRAGMEVLHITMQTADFGPASSTYANAHITRLIGDGHGFRVGDRDTFIEGEREANYLNNLDFLRAYPTVLVVRTDTMQIIADSRDKRRYLPLLEIAANPGGDWRETDRVEVSDNCPPGSEEATEADNNFPNNTPAVGAGSYEGGICNGDADFYRIDIPGRWRATLEFPHDTGDLGMYLWDMRAQQPVTDARGNVVGSDGLTDVETFTHEGTADLLIEGFMRRQTAPYTLTIEAL